MKFLEVLVTRKQNSILYIAVDDDVSIDAIEKHRQFSTQLEHVAKTQLSDNDWDLDCLSVDHVKEIENQYDVKLCDYVGKK